MKANHQEAGRKSVLRSPLSALPFLIALNLLAVEKSIIKSAAPTKNPCVWSILTEAQAATIPHEKLCQLNDVWTALFFPREDATDQALSKVKKAACECGANALIVLRNTSNDGAARIRRREEVDAIAIWIPEGTVTSAQAEPSPRSGAAPANRRAMKPGADGLSWGSPPPPGMTFLSEIKGEACYTRASDAETKQTRVKEVRWCFVDSKFRRLVMIIAKEEVQAIRSSFTQDWGPAKDEDDGFSWTSEDGLSKASITPDGPGDDWFVAYVDWEFHRAPPNASLKPSAEMPTTKAGIGIVADMPSGFSTLNWGSPVPPDTTFMYEIRGENCYSRPSDTKRLGKIKVKGISWCFADGRFRRAMVVIPREDVQPVLSEFTQAWGEPRYESDGYHWTSRDGATRVSITPGGPDNKDGFISYVDWEFRQASIRTATATPVEVTIDESVANHSGTGIVAALPNLIVTNHHVVAGCRSINVNGADARMLASDARSDLALLRSSAAFSNAATFRTSTTVLGEEVTAVGFPLSGLPSQGLVISTGIVASLAGPQGDSRLFQTTAPFQPGNSGGPLLDKAGQVVGIATSTLSTLALAEGTGAIPQNINFAIKAGHVRLFLESHQVALKSSGGRPFLSTSEVVRVATPHTVRIDCR